MCEDNSNSKKVLKITNLQNVLTTSSWNLNFVSTANAHGHKRAISSRKKLQNIYLLMYKKLASPIRANVGTKRPAVSGRIKLGNRELLLKCSYEQRFHSYPFA